MYPLQHFFSIVIAIYRNTVSLWRNILTLISDTQSPSTIIPSASFLQLARLSVKGNSFFSAGIFAMSSKASSSVLAFHKSFIASRTSISLHHVAASALTTSNQFTYSNNNGQKSSNAFLACPLFSPV